MFKHSRRSPVLRTALAAVAALMVLALASAADPAPAEGGEPAAASGAGAAAANGAGPAAANGAGPAAANGAGPAAANAVGAAAANGEEPIIEIFMHDILGGVSPTARPITGLLGNIYSGRVPFAKPLGFVPPEDGVAIPNPNGAVPTVSGLTGIPLGTGLSGPPKTGSQDPNEQQNQNYNNVQNQLGFDGLSLGFGTITVIDDIVTSSPALGSQTLGKAQGVYVASSIDGSTQMMAFTVMMESGEYNDNINLYGVYKIGSAMSHLSVTGGTGRFKNAYGFAEVRPLVPPGQRYIDGVETLLRIIIHLKY